MRWLWPAGAAVAVGLSFSAVAMRRRLDELGDRASLARVTPQKTREGGYLSSSACRACHPAQYASWHDSYHRTMTQEVRPDTVKAPFADQTVDAGGRSFHLHRDGDRFLVDMTTPGSGVTHHRLNVVTGSHHMQVFWAAGDLGNLLTALPVAYLLADQKWVPVMDLFINDPAMKTWQLATWNTSCLRCHSTGALPGGGTRTRVGELGIACEACHGPGEAHVAANHDPLRRWAYHLAGRDPTIVNPARLDARASAEICGTCHGVRWHRDGADFMANGLHFRPGDLDDPGHPLIRARGGIRPPWLAAAVAREYPDLLDGHFWSDGMVRVSGREYNGTIESPCFAGGNFSCLSCHSLHDSDPDDQLRREANDAPCLRCHAGTPSHSHHAPGSSGSACVNCHMPYTTYGLLKSIRSHEISSPTVKESVAVGRPNACNLCHLDRTLAWTNDKLSEWYETPPATLGPDEERIAGAILWLLRGDAGQRAIVADALGRTSARQTSGTDWMSPYLTQLLDDPYAAVRYVAARSLRAPAPPGPSVSRPEVQLSAQERARLLGQRNDRPMNLKE